MDLQRQVHVLNSQIEMQKQNPNNTQIMDTDDIVTNPDLVADKLLKAEDALEKRIDQRINAIIPQIRQTETRNVTLTPELSPP